MRVTFVRRLTTWLAATTLAVLLALGAIAVSPRAACACTTREFSQRAMLRSTLNDIVAEQAAAYAVTGRLRTQGELLQSQSLQLSPSVRITAWTTELAMPKITVGLVHGPSTECWVYLRPDGTAIGDTRCTPYPPDRWHLGLAIAYFALLALAIHGRYTRAGRGLPPVGARTVAQGLFLFAVHPFWDPVRTTEGCRLDRFLYIPALLLVAGTAAYVWWGPFRRKTSPPSP